MWFIKSRNTKIDRYRKEGAGKTIFTKERENNERIEHGLHNFYSRSNSIRMRKLLRIRWVCSKHARYAKRRQDCCKILKGKRLPGRPRRRWEDSLKKKIRECRLQQSG